MADTYFEVCFEKKDSRKHNLLVQNDEQLTEKSIKPHLSIV